MSYGPIGERSFTRTGVISMPIKSSTTKVLIHQADADFAVKSDNAVMLVRKSPVRLSRTMWQAKAESEWIGITKGIFAARC